MDTQRTQVILKDLKNSLEEIIVKLNSHTPQSLHDDIIPMLEDIEMLQSGLNGPAAPPSLQIPTHIPTIIMGDSMQLKDLLGQAGLNGGSDIKAEEITPSVAVRDLHDTLIRMDERMHIAMSVIGKNVSAEQITNLAIIQHMMNNLRAISQYLLEAMLFAEEEMDAEDDENDEQNKFDL